MSLSTLPLVERVSPIAQALPHSAGCLCALRFPKLALIVGEETNEVRRIRSPDHSDLHSGLPFGQHYENRLRLVEAYDRAGIYAYHLAEHHSTPLGVAASPGIFLSAVAQRTRHLRFGPLVYLLPFYHPIRLIEEICMLDQMSGGRLQLGVGRGVSPFETAFYGIDFAQSQQMYHEAYQLVMQGLTADELTFEGKYYRFQERADDPQAGAETASAAVVRNQLAGKRRLARG